MKKALGAGVFAAIVAATLAAAAPSFGQLEKREIQGDAPYPAAFSKPQVAPEIPFDAVDPNYFTGMPADEFLGEISAVTNDSKGHVFILSRSHVSGNTFGASGTQIFEFDENGKYVREIGRSHMYSFAYGHGIRVDKNDDIWMVDKGTNMVTKFDHVTGRPLMVLGRRDELTGKYWREKPDDPMAHPEEGGFGEPTDIAWDSKGNIYVSDGYVHSRVAKFDANGNWIGSWGKRGNGPGEFRTVHNVQIDAEDHVWVADRTNGRIQVFTTDGKFLREVILNVPTKKYQPIMGHQYPPAPDALEKAAGNPVNLAYRPGTPDALCIPPNNKKVVFVGDLYPGRVYKIDLSGKVLGYFAHVGKEPGNTGAIHGLACQNENIIYTAEFENWRVQKFVLHPEKAKVTGN